MGILASIWSGDLPLSVLLNTLHLVLIIFNAPLANNVSFHHVASIILYCFHLLLNLCGFIYLYSFYVHAVENVFNKCTPKMFSDNFFNSFYNFFLLVRPLEIMWRRSTASFRCLPDVLVIGEVRCGTTTMCDHISKLPGCHPPFCPWKHPELDRKETFYFAGHYHDMRPSMYSMCFPLVATRWFYTKVLRRPFFTFDGCAQYLTSPVAPHFLAASYKSSSLPPPALIACAREPVAQALSWWKYEQNAMRWGESMGLTKPNTALRTKEYFSKSIGRALEFSKSPLTEAAYLSAEGVVEGRSPEELEFMRTVPAWALTWPGGQLTGIGRNGRFSSNVARYERVFGRVFGEGEVGGEVFNRIRQQVAREAAERGRGESREGNTRVDRKRYVKLVTLGDIADGDSLRKILKHVARSIGNMTAKSSVATDMHIDFYVDNTMSRGGLKRNPGAPVDPSIDPTEEEVRIIKDHFVGERERLEKVTKQVIRW